MRKIIILTFILLASVPVAIRADENHDAGHSLKVECRMDRETLYEREPVRLTITLISDTPDIEYANIVEAPELKKGRFDTFQTISPAGRAYKEKKNGKTYYCFPLNSYMVTVAEEGKYEIDGGKYNIGINVPAVRHDPFWGSYRYNEVKEITLPVEKKTFRAKAVPNPPSGIEYSGSVGEFSIETVIPPGDIYAGEEAIAVIILRGNGMIAESVLPSYRGAFDKGVRLKSVSESLDEGHDFKGGMLSELRLECTFIVTDIETAEIGEARFDFFNPRTGKYETITTDPVKIKVKSAATTRDRMSI